MKKGIATVNHKQNLTKRPPQLLCRTLDGGLSLSCSRTSLRMDQQMKRNQMSGANGILPKAMMAFWEKKKLLNQTLVHHASEESRRASSCTDFTKSGKVFTPCSSTKQALLLPCQHALCSLNMRYIAQAISRNNVLRANHCHAALQNINICFLKAVISDNTIRACLLQRTELSKLAPRFNNSRS